MATETGLEVQGDPAIGADTFRPPLPAPAGTTIPMPGDSVGYRLKRKLLGPPLHSEELEHQRLGKPTALAIFASDNLSSSAYATEEILHVLIPLVGLAAFSLVVPITFAMVVVLAFLILSYRETIKEYPSAGGAYMVARDNFGVVPAQIAGASLLTDYILTVAVSSAAGTAALVSAFDVLKPYTVPIACCFIAIVAYGNLRGVKESGKVFAVPTYFFIFNMAVLLGLGLWKYVGSDLPIIGLLPDTAEHAGSSTDTFLYGAGLFGVLHAFASGGAAVTGVEAISNGVPAFREPAWKNARKTLVIMGTGLGIMFLGLSALAAQTKIGPSETGTPTVIAQVGEAVYGGGAVGNILFYSLQAGTVLILIMAANTGFADFPRLASFQAGDSFLPRQLMKRGHRLVYSNGVVVLAGVAMLLVIATGGVVTKLIPLYAIGVFTGFTISQAGMVKHHRTHRHPGWRKSIVIQGIGCSLSFLVLLILAVTKFADGAWLILIVLPVMVVLLLRLNRQYEREAAQLETDVPAAATAPILRRHVVLVFVDRLDMASARAIQYARSLTPDEMRAVHFVIDETKADELALEWARTGLHRVPLELVECPDRRLTRAAVECVVRELADGETEVSVLLPDRKYRGIWHRVLHDKTADAILEQVSRLPHANVTSVPFHLDAPVKESVPLSAIVTRRAARQGEGRQGEPPEPSAHDGDGMTVLSVPGCIPIAEAKWRQRVRVAGKVRAVRVAPQHDAPTLELILVDGTASISVIFLGRRGLAGVGVGTHMSVEGTVGIHKTRLAILNPSYQLLG
jgi:amino acid transporter